METIYGFHSLPLELRLKILSYLPEEEHDVVRCVSQTWEEMIDIVKVDKRRKTYKVLLEPPPYDDTRVYFKYYDCVITDITKYQDILVQDGLSVSLTIGSQRYDQYKIPWFCGENICDLHHLIETLQPIELNINVGIKCNADWSLLRKKISAQVIRANITEMSLHAIELLSSFPNFRSLTFYDACPHVKKLLCINALHVTALYLCEQNKGDVLTGHHLYQFFSRDPFNHLVTISLRNSRLNDKTAAAIYKHCPLLWNLDIEKAVDLTTNDCLTKESGLKYFLHMPRLKYIEVTFPKNEDWFYARNKWASHTCLSVSQCGFSVEDLLANWKETNLDVDV